jgi:hypothetical protein
MESRNPVARKAGLVKREVDGELLVYDLERDKAHCLNDSATRIWEYCDGESSVPEIAKLLASDLNASVDHEFVWYALERLEKLHLLEEAAVPSALLSQISRRDAVRRIGLGIVALPLITSIIAPTPAQAASDPQCPPVIGCK